MSRQARIADKASTVIQMPQLFEMQPAKPSVEMLLLQVIQLLQSQQQAAVPAIPAIDEQPIAPEKETMDANEVAEYLRISAWTVYDMVRKSSLPFFRVRSRIFFRRREIEKWVQEQMRGRQS
ncbi:helix-turn-helix domain-containing protein [Paenibacillus sp. MBLB4367]|uniref:helix-turn-helix domain-containing protein n=1 Tax=Paenibacillus sp. MBLB4367 TaxID=3384767 RepID=UPI003908170A